MGIEGFEAIGHALDVLPDGRIGSHHEGDAPPQVVGGIHEGVDVVTIAVDVLQRVLIELLVYRDWETDRKSTRLNSSHITRSRMPSSA